MPHTPIRLRGDAKIRMNLDPARVEPVGDEARGFSIRPTVANFIFTASQADGEDYEHSGLGWRLLCANLTGPKILKDGRDSKVEGQVGYWDFFDTEAPVPAWLQEAADEAVQHIASGKY